MQAMTGWDTEGSLPCVLGNRSKIALLHDLTLQQTQKYLNTYDT